MEPFIENLEIFGLIVKTVLEALSIVIISVGVIVSIFVSLSSRFKSKKKIPLHIDFRIRFGTWLLVSLEFLLAADIVSSVINPTYENLIQLGIVAVIRTFLNYFLGKELTEEKAEAEKIESEE
ncbi:MAG TPA: DUF1622 domain-containing protein [Ignavibacteria bacterium]|nr:DUF1622 domain-containing protein [Ignavibacteria bacterium]